LDPVSRKPSLYVAPFAVIGRNPAPSGPVLGDTAKTVADPDALFVSVSMPNTSAPEFAAAGQA
jgi:hypothetical protein